MDAPMSINCLSFLLGADTAVDFRKEEEVGGLVGVADETYPVKKGAKKKLAEEDRREDRPVTSASPSTGVHVGCELPLSDRLFASLQCCEKIFAWVLAFAPSHPWWESFTGHRHPRHPQRHHALFHKGRTNRSRTA